MSFIHSSFIQAMAWSIIKYISIHYYHHFVIVHSPIRDALQAGVRITGITVHFIAESDTDHDGPIIAQESIHVIPIESESQLETRLRILEQQVYPKAIDMVASGKIIYQGKKRLGKTNFAPTIASSAY